MSETPDCAAIPIGRGVFRVDSRELVVDGAVVRLEPRQAAVLARLTSARGAVVSREELLECWPDESGSDEALTQVVSALRRALGDTERPHRTILTLPKSGYRLAAKPGGKSAGPSLSAAAGAVMDRPVTALALVAGFAVIVIASVAAIDAITFRPPRPDIVLHVPVEPATNAP